MKLSSFAARLPSDFRLVLADVGSAGGLHRRWAALRPIVSGVLFEPREGGQVRQEGEDTIYPIGLGPAKGRATLNLTALANMSSTLEPNTEELRRHARKPDHARVVETLEIALDSLDAIAARDGLRIDAVKIDTQGSELGILQGMRGCLTGSAVIAEVEVSFFRRYRDQPLFCDVQQFMDACGFELIALYRLKRYRWANSAGIGNMSLGGGQRAGRLAYGDAVFFLKESELRSRIAAADPDAAERIVLCSVAALLAYGKADMAARVWEANCSHVREPWRGPLTVWFVRLGRRARGSGILHHVADYFSRHV